MSSYATPSQKRLFRKLQELVGSKIGRFAVLSILAIGFALIGFRLVSLLAS